MRRYSRGARRAPFRSHRKNLTTWLTAEEQSGTKVYDPATVEYMPLMATDNAFVSMETRFAKQNDVITLKRLIGTLRSALYVNEEELTFPPPYDFNIAYGICIVKGDYDNTGVWTQLDAPNPMSHEDDDDKWVWKRSCTLAFDRFVTNVTVSDGNAADSSCLMTSTFSATPTDEFRIGRTRHAFMSTDQLLPTGSYIDIKPHRQLQYAEKLVLALGLQTSFEGNRSFVEARWDLRILTKRFT